MTTYYIIALTSVAIIALASLAGAIALLIWAFDGSSEPFSEEE